MFNCCSHGTLLHFGLQSSRLNVATTTRSAPGAAPPASRPKLIARPGALPTRRGFARGASSAAAAGSRPDARAPSISGWLIRQVSCYALLSGFRLPWPPSCCLYQPTPFMVSHERPRGAPAPAFGSSTAPVLLAKVAHWAPSILLPGPISQAGGASTHLKFDNRSRTFRPQCL